MGEPHHCDHPHTDDFGLGVGERSVELVAAEARCEQANARLTPPRRRVLELLLTSGKPMKAYDLIAGYGADGTPSKPPTVYRALEFLEQHGLAHRIESLNAYIACRELEGSHTATFLICDCCGATKEVRSDATAKLTAIGKAAGYTVSRVNVEAHGLCGSCRT